MLKKNAILYMYPPVFMRVSAMYPLCIRYVSALKKRSARLCLKQLYPLVLY